MASDPTTSRLSPIEEAARAAHRAYYRQLGYKPIAWHRMRAKDRARWVAVAEATIAHWTIARPPTE